MLNAVVVFGVICGIAGLVMAGFGGPPEVMFLIALLLLGAPITVKLESPRGAPTVVMPS